MLIHKACTTYCVSAIKIMNKELSSRYNPKEVEEKWSNFWLENEFFYAREDSKKLSFVIVIPPPNVTGVLHMGHALNNTLQDILIRYKRMAGYNSLWVPGTDHAGIATQNVVERELRKKGLKRENLGREKFIKRVWDWREKYGSTIIKQLKRIGVSCDWSRERFTMDEGLSKAVAKAFILLYQKGLIYRGRYIINWCPRCETALSDEEVEHREIKGCLYYIRYPFANKKGYLTVATTRPETLFGDSAVAVNPKDRRYKKIIGEKVLLPFIEREIPVVGHRLVDLSFGTGAVKVTPAHDPQDFIIGRELNLPSLVVLDTKGHLNENAGKFNGLERFAARKIILDELKKEGLLEKVESHQHRVGHCYRCSTVIEPYLSTQWFVKMKPLAEPAIRVVKEKKIKFYPPRWEKVYLNWLENIQDWCISRQIWWGHRLPVYYCRKCQEETGRNPKSQIPNPNLKGIIVSEEKPEKCPLCGSTDLVQEEDVLDTWFSSWLWPFSVFGWPEETKELKKFYPTDVLITAPEILFFWVARMVMAGLEFKKEIPFHSVYIHGTVRDKSGKKMSKSFGNIIDPLDIIAEVGADSLRFSIVSLTSFSQDIFLSKDSFLLGRNFANKIWNASRLILEKKDVAAKLALPGLPKPIYLPDFWILSSLYEVKREVTRDLENFRFNDAATLLYQFFWHDFCDWYLEIAKFYLREREEAVSVLFYVLDNFLRLLHPFMPFITEELWQRLKKTQNSKKSITISKWPEIPRDFYKPDSISEMEILKDIVTGIRDLRSRFSIPIKSEPQAIFFLKEKEKRIVEENKDFVLYLARLSRIDFVSKRPEEKNLARNLVKGGEVILPLKGLIDFKAEKTKLKKEIVQLGRELEKVREKLKNKDFMKKAPPEIVFKEKEKEKELSEKSNKFTATLSDLI